MNKDRFKFRFYDKQCKMYLPDGHYINGDKWMDDYYEDVDDLPEYIVPEQCTGLKDKNGNLIYEGDIVLAKYSHKSRPEKLIVKWGQGVFHIITAGFWLFDFSPITLETAKKGEDFPESSEIEIIGNVHEQKDNK